jgi:hypothetical protein
VALAEPLGVVVLPYFSDLARENDHTQLKEKYQLTIPGQTELTIFLQAL